MVFSDITIGTVFYDPETEKLYRKVSGHSAQAEVSGVLIEDAFDPNEEIEVEDSDFDNDSMTYSQEMDSIDNPYYETYGGDLEY